MSAYAVLSRAGTSGIDPEARVIGDHFTWFGFAFSLPWLLYHRLWLVFLAVLAAALWSGFAIAQRPEWMLFVLGLYIVLSLIVGLEGQNWRIGAHLRRGYMHVDLIEAPDAELAYALYARKYAGRDARGLAVTKKPGATAPGHASGPQKHNPTGPDLIGLVPMGGDRRI